MPWPRLPKITPISMLLGLLAFLMVGTVLYSRESLLFCEKALYGEMATLAKETKVDKPIKFNEICPDMRQRHENSVNKWLEVILALMVQFAPHTPPDR